MKKRRRVEAVFTPFTAAATNWLLVDNCFLSVVMKRLGVVVANTRCCVNSIVLFDALLGQVPVFRPCPVVVHA